MHCEADLAKCMVIWCCDAVASHGVTLACSKDSNRLDPSIREADQAFMQARDPPAVECVMCLDDRGLVRLAPCGHKCLCR